MKGDNLRTEKVLPSWETSGDGHGVFAVVGIDDICGPFLRLSVDETGRVDLGPNGALSVKVCSS